MAARRTPSKGGKPDKLMRDAILLALHRTAEDGKTKRLTLVADALVKAACAGDIQAIKEINDRVDGKVPQAVTGEGGGPLTVEIVRFAAAAASQ